MNPPNFLPFASAKIIKIMTPIIIILSQSLTPMESPLLWVRSLSPPHWRLSPMLLVVQSLSRVGLFATPWTAACQASLSFTISWNLLKLLSIELVMPSNHLILCRPLLFLPLIFPSIRVLSPTLLEHLIGTYIGVHITLWVVSTCDSFSHLWIYRAMLSKVVTTSLMRHYQYLN